MESKWDYPDYCHRREAFNGGIGQIFLNLVRVGGEGLPLPKKIIKNRRCLFTLATINLSELNNIPT